MTEPPKQEWKTEGLIGVTGLFQSVVLDCSHWESDIPDDQWSTGQLVGVCSPLEVVTGDFINADDDPDPEPAAPPVPTDPIPAPTAESAG